MAGITRAHAFIVDALAERVAQVELYAAFHAVADERWTNIRANGESPRKPTAHQLAKLAASPRSIRAGSYHN